MDADPGNLVKVNWVDANSIPDTISLKEINQKKLADTISVGYLLEETNDCIKICGFVFPDMEHDIGDSAGHTGFRDVLIIPRRSIKSIFSLKIDFKEIKKWKINNAIKS